MTDSKQLVAEQEDRPGTSLTELASPSEVGLLLLAVGAVVSVLLKRRKRRAQQG
ncbi:hypothetical protein ACWKSP_09780 [Micromonosporaceae bacterium Da 78-11]